MGIPQSRIFLTGGSGFVGSHLSKNLQDAGFKVRELRRLHIGQQPSAGDVVYFDGFESEFDLRQSMVGCDVVIHCAGKAHSAEYMLADYRRVNVSATLALAQQAAEAGVNRFIYVSTIKVNGESTQLDHPFKETDQTAASDPYSVSKLEAELGLKQLLERAGIDFVIVRPPLVYGRGVKGNFRLLLRLARSGLPLPFGSVCNRRSTIYVGNLVDFLVLCVHHPAARNEVFFAADARDLSTSELLSLLRREMSLSPRLIPIPLFMLIFLGRVTGKSAMVDRLCGSLQVDCSKAHRVLGWEPPYSVEHGISEMVKSFLKSGF